MSSRTLFFFFQAEDGIRDGHVTGVQTCALPIYRGAQRGDPEAGERRVERYRPEAQQRGEPLDVHGEQRSEEHTSELQSRGHLVCRLLLEKKKKNRPPHLSMNEVLDSISPSSLHC